MGSMPSTYYSPQRHPIPSSGPHLGASKNLTNNEGGGVDAKRMVEEDYYLVKSWMNVRMKPLTEMDQKKSGFWRKVAFAYNRYASDGAPKRMERFAMSIGNRLLHWYPSIAVAWQKHIEGT